MVLVSLLILGCATKPKEQTGMWCPDKVAYENNRSGNVTLKGIGGNVYTIKGVYLWNYYQTSMKLINLTQIPTAVCISETAGLNAFAGKQGNVNRMAMTVDALNKFGNDPDAIAAVMGHELAHLKLDHQSIRQSRKQTSDRTSAIVGGVVGGAGRLSSKDVIINRTREGAVDAAGDSSENARRIVVSICLVSRSARPPLMLLCRRG